MEEKKKISLSNILLIIAIIVICIMAVVIYKMYSKDNTKKINTSTESCVISDVNYIEITIEDEEEYSYKENIKIESQDIIESLKNIINQGEKHEFNGAFGFDISPSIYFYLKNGTEIIVTAIDNFNMDGEEPGNYIMVTENQNEEHKQIYKINTELGEYIKKLYKEYQSDFNEVAKELNVNDSIVQDIVKKFNFEPNVQGSIYKVGSFNLDTIPNDLILRMGWGIANKDEEKTINDSDELRETDKSTQTMTKEVMKKRVKSLFGTNVKYTDASFVNTDAETFCGHGITEGEIIYSNNLYTASYDVSGGDIIPFIHESIQKVLKYEDKVEIYVKTAFVDTDDYLMLVIYSDFDFNNNKFQNEIIRISEEEFCKNYTYTTSLDTSNHSTINSIKNKLNTYVYTFKIDKETGEYYLDSFNEAE